MNMPSPPMAAQVEELRAELDACKLSALQKRARDLGVDGAADEAATDSADPKAAFIEVRLRAARWFLLQRYLLIRILRGLCS